MDQPLSKTLHETDFVAYHFNQISIKHKLAILVFLTFYFIRWLWPMSAWEWSLNILGLALFLTAYFLGFYAIRFTPWCAVFMVVLCIAMAPVNAGANTFAIYGCSFAAYSLPLRPALVFLGTTLVSLAAATLLFGLDQITFLMVSVVASLGTGFMGIFERANIIARHKEVNSQSEIQRLVRIAERERIGQDIHDLLGHSLTAIHVKSQLLDRLHKQGKSEEVAREIQDIQNTAKRAIKEVRHAVIQVNSHSLSNELAAQKEFLNGVGIELDYKLPDRALPRMLESDLIMIAREAITNVVRHSHATLCRFLCHENQRELNVTISDNGVGSHSATAGHGLSGIRRRVDKQHGNLNIQANPGFQLAITIPWNAAHVESNKSTNR